MERRRERRKPKLHAGNVVVRLGDALIVDGAALDLRAGELTVLIGPNGAGKTTLMRALAGLVPAEGRIEIEGKPLATPHGARARAPHRLSAAGPRVPLADAGRRGGRARPLRLRRCVLDAHRRRPGRRRQGARGHRHGGVRNAARSRRCPAANARASRWRGHWPARRRSCSPTSRRCRSIRVISWW